MTSMKFFWCPFLLFAPFSSVSIVDFKYIFPVHTLCSEVRRALVGGNSVPVIKFKFILVFKKRRLEIVCFDCKTSPVKIRGYLLS